MLYKERTKGEADEDRSMSQLKDRIPKSFALGNFNDSRNYAG
ncbi:MAG: hypothetical protein SWY16_15190 [Cyanobacteriota bacterium]|nr:hypothetical protein [Cyanobacteriota bacterium]